MKISFWDLACLGVLGIVLSLGLWPFHSPDNDVTWLGNRNGLRVGRFGSLVSRNYFQQTNPKVETSGTVEVWLQPLRVWDRGTFLAFYTPGNPYQFSLRQFDGGLNVQAEILNGAGPARTVVLRVKDAFLHSGAMFLTIASGDRGTAVYKNGVLTTTGPKASFSTGELMGRVVVGDSPGQPDNWSGQLLGLAIYGQQLTAAQVVHHYRTWTRNDRPDISANESIVALYLLDEHTGRIVHDHAHSGVDLYIPEKYTVADQILLEPFWKEFSMSRSYWSAVVKNIVGFIPLGFVLFGCLLVRKVKRPVNATVTIGALVSLTIEVLQSHLPTRNSGMTDIITNTVGTYVGVVACRGSKQVLADKLSFLQCSVLPRS